MSMIMIRLLAVDLSLSIRFLSFLLAVYIVHFLYKLYKIRSYFQKLQRGGLPMPPHRPVFGHLLITHNVLSELPRDAHAHYLPSQLRLKYPTLGPVYYLDMWPFAPPFLVATSPDVIWQFTQSDAHLPNHPGIRNYLRPITGGGDLASMEGEEWKKWRKIYNPGFSAGHIQTLVPTIVEEVGIFVDTLKEHARKGDMFSLDEAAINATMDVIGRVALDHKFNTQHSPNPMTTALRSQIRWCSFGAEPNPFDYMNPFKPLVHWYNTRIMNKYMTKVLQERYPSSSAPSNKSNPTSTPPTKSRAVIDLAHTEYLSSTSPSTTIQSFAPTALPQMKLFILGGHDTTATTITYLFHLLSLPQNSTHLLTLQKEHTRVFGPNPASAASMLTNQPELLNQLPYTLATIKETLRLFPVVTAPRAGREGHFLTYTPPFEESENAVMETMKLPTQHCLVWSNHHALHTHPLYWPQPQTFLPERWLVGPEHPLHPLKDAWRPFEYGPRACIGRELAVTELKVVMVLSVRRVRVKGVYGEWDERTGWWGGRRDERVGTKGKNERKKDVMGERAYQIQLGSARASDGFPARASLVEWDEVMGEETGGMRLGEEEKEEMYK